MALRIPAPSCCRSSTNYTNSVVASIKSCQQPYPRRVNSNSSSTRRKKPSIRIEPSPLRTAEEIASSFAHEIRVLELERLFQHPSGPCPPAPDYARRPVRVAYQGVRGSYCQEAALKAFPTAHQAFPCDRMDEAFRCIEEKTADRAVVPVENSIDGAIDRNFDLLLRHGGVRILSELVVSVNHCLLAVNGTSASGIKRVLSHPQALSHCRARLMSMNMEVEEVANAADAAEYISDNQIMDTAVIGSKIAAKEFGLSIIQENFQDKTENFNRFLQLGPMSAAVAGTTSTTKPAEKTTVAFALTNGISDLYRAMWQFESRGVHVARVEHRPNRTNPIRSAGADGKATYFDYVFILDVDGSLSDKKVSSAVRGLEEISGFLRVLGSYTCIQA